MDNLIINKLQISPIKQFQNHDSEKGVYFGIWSFGEIVKSLKFTHREPLNYNILAEVNTIKKKFPEFNTDYYQRLINDERTKKVIQFIIKEIIDYNDSSKQSLITFPTSLILSLYLSEADSEFEYLGDLKNLNTEESNFENVGVYLKDNVISLPNINIMLVVDGQHRLAGLYAIYYALLDLIKKVEDTGNILDRKIIDYAQKSLIKLQYDTEKLESLRKTLSDFQFCCTILLDFDIWEQGRVFADVNFNQKPVNKSLYYDIFGSYPDPDRNDIYLAHTWAVFLNSNTDSALFGKIKLLGTGSGYFSQASFVEALLPMLRKNGIWSEVVSNFILTDHYNKRIQDFLNIYFITLKELYINFWPINDSKTSSYKDILLKTTGLNAVIKLIPLIYPKIKESLYEDDNKLKKEITYIFTSGLQAKIEKTKSDIDKLNKKIIIATDSSIKNKIENEILDLKTHLDLMGRKLSGEYYFSKDGNYSKGGGKGLQDRLYKQLKEDLDL